MNRDEFITALLLIGFKEVKNMTNQCFAKSMKSKGVHGPYIEPQHYVLIERNDRIYISFLSKYFVRSHKSVRSFQSALNYIKDQGHHYEHHTGHQ